MDVGAAQNSFAASRSASVMMRLAFGLTGNGGFKAPFRAFRAFRLGAVRVF